MDRLEKNKERHIYALLNLRQRGLMYQNTWI